MEDRINQALAQLEKDLQEINSARNQVESTVKASAELQKVVREYVSSVKALCVGLQAWESELRTREGRLSHEYEEAISRVNSTCNEIRNSFGAEVEKTSTEFKNKTNPIVEKFTEQIGKLEKHVQDLNSLRDEIKKTTGEIESVKGTLTQISKDLKESQESQDAVLNDLKQKSDGIIGKADDIAAKIDSLQGKADGIAAKIDSLQGKADGIAAKIDSLHGKADGITAKIDSLHGKADNISSQLSQVDSMSHEIKTACEQIHSTLKASTESLQKTLEKSKNETIKNININRWIIIAAFIILLIIHFIR